MFSVHFQYDTNIYTNLKLILFYSAKDSSATAWNCCKCHAKVWVLPEQ